MPGHNTNYIFKNDNEVICSTEFAEITRLKYGELKVVLYNERPSANSSFSPDLLQFSLTRHIRVRFQGELNFVYY
jgi:laminin alpha 1/2